MGYALVGSAGVVGTAAAGAAVTGLAYGQTPTANNLLILFATAQGGSTGQTAPSGWTQLSQVAQSTTCVASIFYKIAAGGDAVPSLPGITAETQRAQLCEFSGGDTSSPSDQTGTATTTTASMTATSVAVDAVSGELIVYCSIAVTSAGAARTVTDSLNNGATATNTANTNGANVANHYSFGYGITTGNSSADSDSWTISSATNLTGAALVIGSFKIAAAGAMTAPTNSVSPLAATMGLKAALLPTTATSPSSIAAMEQLAQSILAPASSIGPASVLVASTAAISGGVSSPSFVTSAMLLAAALVTPILSQSLVAAIIATQQPALMVAPIYSLGQVGVALNLAAALAGAISSQSTGNASLGATEVITAPTASPSSTAATLRQTASISAAVQSPTMTAVTLLLAAAMTTPGMSPSMVRAVVNMVRAVLPGSSEHGSLSAPTGSHAAVAPTGSRPSVMPAGARV